MLSSTESAEGGQVERLLDDRFAITRRELFNMLESWKLIIRRRLISGNLPALCTFVHDDKALLPVLIEGHRLHEPTTR